MPDVPHRAAVFESHAPYRLFVANDCGVWMTEDLRHWVDLSRQLPNVVVNSLVYHHDDRILTVATYGRGIWRLHLPGKDRTRPPELWTAFFACQPFLLTLPRNSRTCLYILVGNSKNSL